MTRWAARRSGPRWRCRWVDDDTGDRCTESGRLAPGQDGGRLLLEHYLAAHYRPPSEAST